jgi:hypothetical protein
MVQKGYTATSAWAAVRALKIVVFPALGSPTMPQRHPIRGFLFSVSNLLGEKIY